MSQKVSSLLPTTQFVFRPAKGDALCAIFSIFTNLTNESKRKSKLRTCQNASKIIRFSERLNYSGTMTWTYGQGAACEKNHHLNRKTVPRMPKLTPKQCLSTVRKAFSRVPGNLSLDTLKGIGACQSGACPRLNKHQRRGSQVLAAVEVLAQKWGPVPSAPMHTQ